MNWAIYISIPIVKKGNFDLGLERSIWGHKKDVYGDLKDGDTIFFVERISTGGSSGLRVKKLTSGTASRICKGRVTGAPYMSEDQLWHDDTYPYRFSFEILDEFQNVEFPSELIPPPLAEAVRLSANAASAPYSFFFDEISEHHSNFESSIEEQKISGKKYSVDEIGNRVPPSSYKKGIVYDRDPRIVIEARRRAGFTCEVSNCTSELFHKPNGDLYLEVHHLDPLSKGGPDILSNAVCLCPNHHREIHFGTHRDRLRADLVEKRKFDNPN